MSNPMFHWEPQLAFVGSAERACSTAASSKRFSPGLRTILSQPAMVRRKAGRAGLPSHAFSVAFLQTLQEVPHG